MSDDNFGQSLVDALARELLKNQIGGMNPDGQPIYVPSPVANLASTIMRQNEAKLLKVVSDAVDMDTLIQQVADKTVERLVDLMNEIPDANSYMGRRYNAHRLHEKLEPIVREKLAEKLAERALEQMDADK